MRKHLLNATAISLLVAGPLWAAGTAAARDPGWGAGTVVAQAKTADPQTPMMSEQELEKNLHQQGFTAIGMLKLNGDTYEA